MTVYEAIGLFNSSLTEFMGEAEATSCAKISIEKICGIERSEISFNRNNVLSVAEVNQLNNIILELKTGRPLQYILNEAWFCDMPFYVDDRVLIPRPETEELIAAIVKPYDFERPLKVLDIGTGSGCIPIALAKAKPHWDIYAIDVSLGALEVAAINAQLNNVQVLFQLVDVLNENQSTAFFKKHGAFDIIVSNPPYIGLDEKKTLASNVLNFEPHLALFAHENDPLIFYRRINELAAHYLSPGGNLYYEINEYKGDQMLDLMKTYHFEEIELIQDLNNKNRIIKAVK